MKITGVSAIASAIPFRAWSPPTTWYERVTAQVIVRLDTDSGLTGVGEAFAYGSPRAVAAVVEDVLASAITGLPIDSLVEGPAALAAFGDRLQRAGRLAGREGAAMFAVSGVDVALWDLAGKMAGKPVSALLGGAQSNSLPAYASHPRYESAAGVAEGCGRSVRDGFTRVKLHETEAERLAAARDAAGAGVEIMVDTNCPWDVPGAIAAAHAMAPWRPAWLEEPIWPPEDYAALAAVRQAAGMPIAAGENEYTLTGFRDAIGRRAIDILQPSVAKCGGLSVAAAAARQAQAAGIRVVPHSFYFGPALAATLHLVSTFTESLVEFPLGELEEPLLTEPIAASGGVVTVPDAPGLGVEVNWAAMERWRIR